MFLFGGGNSDSSNKNRKDDKNEDSLGKSIRNKMVNKNKYL